MSYRSTLTIKPLKTKQIPLWLIKIFTYEYWTWWVFYIPLIPYWLYQAVRTRSLTFFTNADPCIDYGGFFGESKIDILKQIPQAYLPKTIFITQGCSFEFIMNSIQSNGLAFPIIAKPNIGERGFEVEKIGNEEALQKYFAQHPIDFIIQEYVSYEIELGILYYRMPESTTGKVTSVTRKEFLSVVGDGQSTVQELMQKSTRARFQLDNMKQKLGQQFYRIYPPHEKVLLEPIGNHCRGTKFLNNNNLITKELHEVFDKIALPIQGFHYGRFDLRVRSIGDLYKGEHIRIMELNGVSAEPGHIYDPSYKLLQAYKDLAFHWRIIADISIQQQKAGIMPVPTKVLWQVVKRHFFK